MVKPVKHRLVPCFSVHGVLVLSGRSLADRFGTLTGTGVPGYTASMDTVALVGVPGWWVMVVVGVVRVMGTG